MVALFYVGNLKAISESFSGAVLNTDQRRTVELRAPVSSQGANSGEDTFISGLALEDFYMTFAEKLRPREDPFLANLPAGEVRYAEVGLLYFQYLLMAEAGNSAEARAVMDRMTLLAPDFAASAAPSTSGRR